MLTFRRSIVTMSGAALALACSGETSESGGGGTGGTPSGGTGATSGAAGSTGGNGGASGAAGSAGGAGGASGAAGSAGGAGGGTLEYVASLADCINPAEPNPDTCESFNGGLFIAVDGDSLNTGQPSYGYLRFELDAALTGKSVTAVRLVLRTGPFLNASSDQSGEVWQVAPFERADLFVAVPAPLGSGPVAESMGGTDPEAIPADYDVVWELPPSLVEPGSSLFFGILPLSDDGVYYHNAKAVSPPTLYVDYD